MNYFEKIKELINENQWEKVDYAFSQLKSFKEDRDGNPEYFYFFQDNISQAIVLAEKHNLISQTDIMFSLSFSGSDFRKALTYTLLESKTLNPDKLFKNIINNKERFSELSIIKEDIFNLILNFYKDNDIKNILDSETLKTIFSNEERKNTLNNSKALFKFMLQNSSVNDYFFFNNLVERKNYYYLSFVLKRWQEDKNEINYESFKSSVHDSLVLLEKNYKHPFTSSKEKNELKIILEDINKISLFLSFKDKPVQSNHKNRHKI